MTDARTSRRWRTIIWGAVIFGLVVLVFFPALRGGFIWDDDADVTANPCVVGPLGLKEIWSTAAADYFPLVLSNFRLQHALWGLNPVPYHAITLLCHALCAVLLWRVLVRLQIPGAWLGAALWAVHPVQVESVAWIAELKNTQSGLFYLLAIDFYLRWRGEAGVPQPKQCSYDYALALFCALLAILSKPSTVMLPAVLGLCAWWRGGQLNRRALARLMPFLALAVAASGWAIWEQQFHSGARGPDWNQSLAERFIIAGRDVWFYLGKLAWPHPLIFIYPRWQIRAVRLADALPLFAAAAGVLALWLGRTRVRRPGFFAASYFCLLLFPVMDFFKVYFFHFSFVADHFQYLASMGPLALAAAGITVGADRLLTSHSGAAKTGLGVLLLAIWGVQSWRQCHVYLNNEVLWSSTCDLNPDCWQAQNNLGIVLSKIPGRLADAIARYQEALRTKPDYPEALDNLGMAYASLPASRPQAIAAFEAALRLKPRDFEAQSNLGSALAESGKIDEAIPHFQAAVELTPNDPAVRYNLGNALGLAGRLPEAIDSYEAAIELKPAYAEAHFNLGCILLLTPGGREKAKAQFETTLRLKPTFPKVAQMLQSLQ